MSLARISLESFETSGDLPKKESAEYQRGYNAGRLWASEQAETETQKHIAAIATRFEDMTFTFAEANVFLSERLRPLLLQVAEAVLPAIAKETFAAHLVETIQDHFNDIAGRPIEIAVPPDAVSDLSALKLQTSEVFKLVPNPDLSLGQAIIRHDDAHLIVDVSALISDLQAALNGFELSKRKQQNG